MYLLCEKVAGNVTRDMSGEEGLFLQGEIFFMYWACGY